MQLENINWTMAATQNITRDVRIQKLYMHSQGPPIGLNSNEL